MLLLGTALAIPMSLLAAFAPSDTVLFIARLGGGIAAGMAYPTTLALITALWAGPGRTKSIALWSAIGGAIAMLGPLCSGFLLEHFYWGSVFLITLPLAVVAIVLAWLFVPAHVNESTEPVDNLGGILSLALVGALILAINFAPVPNKGTLTLVLAAIARAGARRVLPPSTPREEPALRPGRRLPPRLLGGGLRRGDRVRLADGRGVRESAVPPERPRLLDAAGGRGDPAGRGVHGARRTALRQARRGTRRPLHAAVRLRVPPLGLHHDAAPLEGGQLRTGRSRSPTSSSASVSGSRARPHRIRSRAPCRSDVPGWPRAPPTSSATSAGRSCSRSSGRCSPRATRPPRGR